MSYDLPRLSHHSYLIVGSNDAHMDLISFLENTHGIPYRANPDFYSSMYHNFTIDDARELKSQHSTRPAGETGRKIFIIVMNGVTVEAQNALLKLLEEPAEYAHFFLIVSSPHVLLPTVRSRMQEIKHTAQKPPESAGDLENEAHAFLKKSPAQKLEVIKKLMEDITKEKKYKQDAINFLNAVEKVVHKSGVKGHTEALSAIELARTYMNDRSPSVKMLLEYVSLKL